MNSIITPNTKVAMAQALWLTYFNQTAYEKGLISEAQRNLLKHAIAAQYNWQII